MTVFRILHVCTGNICRSPMAERLTRLGLEERVGGHAARFAVTSAGTWGHEGSGMELAALQALAELGADGRDFRARELAPEHVRGADLVLGATREHRTQAVTLVPEALARTFTLREFSRTAAVVALVSDGWPQDPVERARAVVAATAGIRGTLAPGSPGTDDVVDPYGAPLTAFQQCAHTIAEALVPALDALAGRGAHRTIRGGS
jgi:protein-tyrosine phosphatase